MVNLRSLTAQLSNGVNWIPGLFFRYKFVFISGGNVTNSNCSINTPRHVRITQKKNNKRDYFISSSNIQTDAIIKIAVSTKPTNKIFT